METLRYEFDLRGFDLNRVGTSISMREGAAVAMTLHLGAFVLALVAQAVADLWVWLPLVVLIAGAAIYPIHRSRQMRAAGGGPLLGGPARVRLDPDGYRRRGEATLSEGSWTAVEGVTRMRHHIVLRFGTGSILPVSHDALSPLDPDEAADRIEGWIAGSPAGAAIDVADEIMAGDVPAMMSAANRHRAGHRLWKPLLSAVGGVLAMVLFASVSMALGLSDWVVLALIAAILAAFLWWTRREGARLNDEASRSAPFNGALSVVLAPEGWSVDGPGWRLAGEWRPDIRVQAIAGAAVLRIGAGFFLPIPKTALAPHSAKDVATYVERMRRREG
ncbi:hypothetical protein [Jannaschia aquimarina]|uniref:Uncharacterized protein n=2 Tax=Jannaschia aquimarina TaxID=935700 RepID=A0A0D1EFR2_9RHOB|nr:hypothetical protein [Jannaschia aquimarina]KIT16519.1 hypothetical protein jaqu_17470 [Jannaschia aquimarina]SNT06623.1 hypothetical protein SAMN05421775_10598 [Jannaschia aquimarina]